MSINCRNFKKAEKEGLQEIDKFKDSIEEQINQLELMEERISASLEAQPEHAFFKSFDNIGVEIFKSYVHNLIIHRLIFTLEIC